MKIKQVHGIVSGRVQGVGFRYFVKQIATQSQCTGWVRNNFTGTVEFIAQGTEKALDTFLLAVEKGPSASQVENLTLTWSEATPDFTDFKIKRLFF